MDVFFTSFGEGLIGKSANSIYYEMNQLLKQRLREKNYGDGISQWFLMFILVPENSTNRTTPERMLYKKKSRELDMRLFVDYEAFRSGNVQMRKYLLYLCMKRSLDVIEAKKFPDFNIEGLKADFEKIAKDEGWSAPTE